MMKIALATGIALVALTGGAFSADLSRPVYSAPVAVHVTAPSTSWDGPYVGAHIGYGWGTVSSSLASSASPTGFLAGAQVGYNFHLSDMIVAGVQGDLSWDNASGTYSPGTDTFRENWDGAVVGRLGVDVNGILPYVEAGVAFANATVTTATPNTFSATHTGWTAGVGVQFALADKLSADVEYRYSDYGSQTYGNGTDHFTDSTVRVGLNYGF
jgi:outer membrane immunogenic protein